ncbi:MAG: hypothetical protein JJT75_12235 [Opitutales bacterium]|nr:hypothetical protein [Opitutales bacterium]
MKHRTTILIILFSYSILAGKAYSDDDAFASLSDLFESSDIIVRFENRSGPDNEYIPERSYRPYGRVTIIENMEIFYASSPLVKNSIAEKGRFYFWGKGPNPPDPEDWKALGIENRHSFFVLEEYIAFLYGPVEIPGQLGVYREEILFDENDQAFVEKEYLHDVNSAFVPRFYGYGRVATTPAAEIESRDARNRGISERLFQINQDSMKKLYGTIDRLAIRDAFAEVFASYPEMPSETTMEKKGEDFSVAATRIHEALVEAFGKEGLRRLESGVMVPVEDEAAEEESE